MKFLANLIENYLFLWNKPPNILPEMVYYLESFDPTLVHSTIPNDMLSCMASDHVKVMLTAEGVDELYAGYSYLKRYDDNAGLLQNKEALIYYCMLQEHYQDEWIMPNMCLSRSL